VRFGAAIGGASIIVLEVDGRTFGVQVEQVESMADVADVLVTPVEEARSAGGLARGLAPVPGGTAMVIDAGALQRAALAAV
jgi:chemotaxis signal transduction protein